MKKNDELVLEITDMTDEGLGVGKADGFTYFVKDSIAGDTVLCGVTKLKKSYGYARLIRIIKSSPDRIEPPCPVARQCGGCQLQQLDYGAQLRLKENKVKNALIRIGGFPEEQIESLMEPIMPSVKQLRYRNKAQFPIGRGKDGGLRAGFYAGRTHHIVACEDCLLGCGENAPLLRCILEWMERFDLEPYEESAGKGLLRHVLLRKGFYTGELMVCLVINAEKLPHEKELVESLLALQFPKAEHMPQASETGDPAQHHGTAGRIASISYNVNREKTNVILGKKLVSLYGPDYIEDQIRRLLPDGKGGFLPEPEGAPICFRISPLSFYQVNPAQMERLYSTALEYAGLTGQETVWDVYCGIGTISLFLARSARKVYGVEIVPEAIENARENAERNGIRNAEFFTGKAEEVLPRWYEEQQVAARQAGHAPEKIDVIVVDPPRKGCDERCLETILKMAPERVVYVSCDSSTLARDLKYLCANGYELKRVRPCDMFPQTVHCETVCLLSNTQSKKKESYITLDVEMADYYRIKNEGKNSNT